MTLWFDFPGGWGEYKLNGMAEKELAATGAHGYPTQAEARAHVNAPPNLLQQPILEQLKLSSVSPVGAGVGGTLQTPNSTGGIGGTLSNVLGGQNTSSWFLRIGEGLAGLVVLYVGVKALTPRTAQTIMQPIKDTVKGPA